jgi:hypothetical protein
MSESTSKLLLLGHEGAPPPHPGNCVPPPVPPPSPPHAVPNTSSASRNTVGDLSKIYAEAGASSRAGMGQDQREAKQVWVTKQERGSEWPEAAAKELGLGYSAQAEGSGSHSYSSLCLALQESLYAFSGLDARWRSPPWPAQLSAPLQGKVFTCLGVGWMSLWGGSTQG